MTTIREVQNAVAAVWGVSRNDLLSRRRLRRLARPRQAAMYLAKLITGRSTVLIGREFDRDHTTVMHAIGLVPELMQADGGFAANIGRASMLLAQAGSDERQDPA